MWKKNAPFKPKHHKLKHLQVVMKSHIFCFQGTDLLPMTAY